MRGKADNSHNEQKLPVARVIPFMEKKTTEHHGGTPGDKFGVRGYTVQSPKEVHFKTALSFNITHFFVKENFSHLFTLAAFFSSCLTPAWKRQRPMENRKAEHQKDLTTSEIATVSSSLETQTAPNLQH